MSPFFFRRKAEAQQAEMLEVKKLGTGEAETQIQLSYILLHHIALPKARRMSVRTVEEG